MKVLRVSLLQRQLYGWEILQERVSILKFSGEKIWMFLTIFPFYLHVPRGLLTRRTPSMNPFETCKRAVDVLIDVLEGKRADKGHVDLISPEFVSAGTMSRAKIRSRSSRERR